MKKFVFFLLLIIIIATPENLFSKTIKNLIIFLGIDSERKPVLISVELSRSETSIKEKTETIIKIKYLNNGKLQSLYEDTFISDLPIDKLGFKKNILINILQQNQIEIGTTGLNYNFNIISLAQKKRATYNKTINNIKYSYYINTAFFGKNGSPFKGNLLFLEAESSSEHFDIPEILYMADNLNQSWFLIRFSKNTQAVLFSDSADYFKTAQKYSETNKSIKYNMDKGLAYNQSALFNIPQLKVALEIYASSEYEEPIKGGKNTRIYVYSVGYAHTRNGMTSIFGIRILNNKK